MARKAFLYTGATFLVMMTLLISVNYLMLSKHTGYESKAVVLEVDMLNNLVSDARHAIVLDPDNAMADALSDAGFFALTQTSSWSLPVQLLKSRLDPTNPDSEKYFTNISKWLLNYTNITLSRMKNLGLLKVNFSYPVSNTMKIAIGYRGPPNLPYIIAVSYAANISYALTFNGSMPIKLNQTVQKNKTLTIVQYTVNDPKEFCMYVTDEDTGTVDFKKAVLCTPSCVPTSSFTC